MIYKRAIYIGGYYSNVIGLTGNFNVEDKVFFPDDKHLVPFSTKQMFLYFPHDTNEWLNNENANKALTFRETKNS